MKIKKKYLLPISILLGVLMIISAAFADSLNKPAYDQLKDAVKFTSSAVGNEITSYRADLMVVLKDNGEVILTQSSVNKLDIITNSSEETTSVETAGNVIRSSYNYRDKDGSIWYDSYNDIYYVNNYQSEYYYPNDYYYNDPFANEAASDVERIIDALVGNLKNYITVKTNDDGSKEFSGSLSDAQIPALINAVVSFAAKQYFSSRYSEPVYYSDVKGSTGSLSNKPNLPKITGDVFIKSVKGRADISHEGYINGVFLNGVLSGKDPDGINHDISVEILITVSDINETVITRPDLTGKKVEEVENSRPVQEVLSSKYEGIYRTNIVLDLGGNFEKIGERSLYIDKVEDGTITGRYIENYKDGYEDRINELSEFDFEAVSNDKYSAEISFTDKSGDVITGHLYFDPNTANVSIWINTPNYQKTWDSNFIRVFE